MHAELQSPELCRVRAITAFTVLPADAASWEGILSEAKSQCDRLAASLARGGYQVQSIRIVSNPFGEYLDTSDIAASKAGLERIRNILTRINQNSSLRIRFAIGEACTAAEIALLPELIKDYGDLCNACVNVHADANCLPDNETILRCVEAVGTIGRITPRGEGNFNFTVNFNCSPLIPYFPAGYHRGEQGNCLVVGLETPDLLAAALRRLNNLPEEHTAYFQTAFNAMCEALQHHVDAVQQYITETPLSAGWQYAGMDTSAAPSKNCTSMVELYRLLRVPHFGAAGTVEASALLTRRPRFGRSNPSCPLRITRLADLQQRMRHRPGYRPHSRRHTCSENRRHHARHGYNGFSFEQTAHRARISRSGLAGRRADHVRKCGFVQLRRPARTLNRPTFQTAFNY